MNDSEEIIYTISNITDKLENRDSDKDTYEITDVDDSESFELEQCLSNEEDE